MSDPRMREKDWARTVEGLARLLGWTVFHQSHIAVRAEPGYPDLTLVRENRDGTASLCFLELKVGKGKLTPAQKEWLDVLSRVPGVTARCVYPSDFERVKVILGGFQPAPKGGAKSGDAFDTGPRP